MHVRIKSFDSRNLVDYGKKGTTEKKTCVPLYNIVQIIAINNRVIYSFVRIKLRYHRCEKRKPKVFSSSFELALDLDT